MKNKVIDDLKAWLQKQPVDTLVEMIVDKAVCDHEFYTELKLRIEVEKSTPDVDEIRYLLKSVIEVDDYISWREVYDYTNNVSNVVSQIEAMLPDHPVEVLELVQEALELWEEAIELVDDDGDMGMILDDLLEIHLKACELVKPDPVKLADYLYNASVSSGWGLFGAWQATYGGLLGDKGIARFRALTEKEWKKVPCIKPGKKSSKWDSRQRSVFDQMLTFVKDDGDLNKIIKVMSNKLSEPYNFVSIAEYCREAGEHELALQWAEKGLGAFSEFRSYKLHSILADEYLRKGRLDDALNVIWTSFESTPRLERYIVLAEYAGKVNVWPEWREKAIKHLRKERTKSVSGSERSRHHWAPDRDNSELVRVFLWEKNTESAWEEAEKGGCAEILWLQLAELSEKSAPERAVPIYRRQVEPLLKHKNNPSYRKAVGYLGRIHRLMVGMDRETEFKQDLHAIKTEWKRLRNFIKYVEQEPWGKVT